MPIYNDVNDLDYADDIAMVSSRLGDMRVNLGLLKLAALQDGRKITYNNIKAMKMSGERQQPDDPLLDINVNRVENVDSVTYLGSQISSVGGAKAEINCRVRKAQCTFAYLKTSVNPNSIYLTKM